LRHAQAAQEHSPKIVLGRRIALVGRFAIPLHSRNVVLFHAGAGFKGQSSLKLRGTIPCFGTGKYLIKMAGPFGGVLEDDVHLAPRVGYTRDTRQKYSENKKAGHSHATPHSPAVREQ
jgi:hypothetical protein